MRRWLSAGCTANVQDEMLKKSCVVFPYTAPTKGLTMLDGVTFFVDITSVFWLTSGHFRASSLFFVIQVARECKRGECRGGVEDLRSKLGVFTTFAEFEFLKLIR